MRKSLGNALLPLALVAGAAILSAFLTRALFDWNAEAYPWWRAYLELAFFLLLPAALGQPAWFRGSLTTFLLAAGGAAVAAAVVAGDYYTSRVGYDNADSLVVALFVKVAVQVFALGLLLPLGFALFQLWPSHEHDDRKAQP